MAAAAAAWLWERVRDRGLPAIRAFHVAIGLYLAAGVVSMAFAAEGGTAAKNVLLMLELAVLALLTSEFASDQERRNGIVAVVVFVSLSTAALAAVGLVLFYAGVETSLLGEYGDLTPSDRYARVATGFHSAPLLGSFCIFASAVVAREDAPLSQRLRLMTQVALGALVLVTFSRAILGFAAALGIRLACSAHSSRALRAAGIAVVIASIAVVGALTVGSLELDPTRPGSIGFEVSDEANRRETFTTSLDTLADHPVVGEGPGSLVGEQDGAPYRAHMTALNIAATMGLPALAAAGFLLFALWRNRRRPTPVPTWSGLAGLGVDALASDVEHFRHVWVMVGMADADRQEGSRPTG